MNMHLFQDALFNEFHSSGYYIIDHFISTNDVKILKEQIDKLIKTYKKNKTNSVFSSHHQQQHNDTYFMSSGDKIRFFEEECDPKQRSLTTHHFNKIGHALHDLDPIFKKFSYQQKIYDLLLALHYIDPKIICSQYLFKLPNIGSAVDFHQDATFVYTQPSSTVTFWIALDDAKIENGCLYVIPKGHKQPLQQKFIANEKSNFFEQLSDNKWQEKEAIPLIVKAGGLIIMDGNLPHMSKMNLSKLPRHAYIMNIIEGNYTYPNTNWIQRSANFPFSSFPQKGS